MALTIQQSLVILIRAVILEWYESMRQISMDLDNNRRKEPGDHEYRAPLETFFCNWEQRNGVEVDRGK